MSNPRMLGLLGSLLAIALVGGASWAFAHGPGPTPDVIHACVNPNNGEIRIGETCPGNWTALDWNGTGIQGPVGPQGPQGERGEPGETVIVDRGPLLTEIGRGWQLSRRPPDNSGRSDFNSVPSDVYLLIDHVSIDLVTTGPVDSDSIVHFRFAGGSAGVEFPVRPLTPNGTRFFVIRSFNPPIILNPGNPITTDVWALDFPAGVTLDFSRATGVTLQGRRVPVQAAGQ